MTKNAKNENKKTYNELLIQVYRARPPFSFQTHHSYKKTSNYRRGVGGGNKAVGALNVSCAQSIFN